MAIDYRGPWPIDVEKLKREALELEAIAKQCANRSQYASDFYGGLTDLIEKAKAGKITTTQSAPGGGRMFSEGYLDEFPELFLAYTRFESSLTFGESEAGKSILRRGAKLLEKIKKEDQGKS